MTSTSRTARCGPACRVVWEGPSLKRLAPIPIDARAQGLVANSLRELRSLHSNSRDEVRARGALRALAMGPVLLGASQARRRLCGSGFAETLAVFVARTTGAPTSCQVPPDRGDFWYPSTLNHTSSWRVAPGTTRRRSRAAGVLRRQPRSIARDRQTLALERGSD